MKTEDKLNIQANRLLGEFIGTLEGICLWEIPEELKLKLQTQLTALRKVKIISSNLPVIKSVCDLDGKTILVTFKVSKMKPNPNIEQ